MPGIRTGEARATQEPLTATRQAINCSLLVCTPVQCGQRSVKATRRRWSGIRTGGRGWLANAGAEGVGGGGQVLFIGWPQNVGGGSAAILHPRPGRRNMVKRTHT